MFDPLIRILVVDDMMTMRKLVIKNLKDMGFSNFLEASDGAKAWELLSGSETPVGLIVSDWNMPNCTGMDLLKRVRAEGRFQKLPFILVTAEAEKHQIAEALSVGVSGYIIKPFTQESLKSQMESVHKKNAA